MPKKAANTAASTVVSKVIGMLAGKLKNGLPLTIHGHSQALAHHCSSRPPPRPPRPTMKTIQGRIVFLMPIAGSMPCTGNGL